MKIDWTSYILGVISVVALVWVLQYLEICAGIC